MGLNFCGKCESVLLNSDIRREGGKKFYLCHKCGTKLPFESPESAGHIRAYREEEVPSVGVVGNTKPLEPYKK